MKHNYFFRWLAVVFVITIFVSFALMSPSASAQEGNPPTLTDTPTEISTEEPGFYPTIVPTPTVPLEIVPDDPQPFSAQSLDELAPQNISGGWSLPQNISLSASASIDPNISVAPNGSVHIVWVEVEGGHSDVVYKYRDESDLWSSVINVSNSGSFSAGTPQITTDSNNTAHIVWSVDDFNNSEVMYTRCSGGSCLPAVNLSGPANWDCGKYPPNLWDWKSEFPTIGIDESNQIMVLWRAYEPNEITMPYSTWDMTGSPPAIRSGCIPYNPDIPIHIIGASRVVGRGERDFRLVYEELPNGGPPRIYYGIYSDNSFTKWTTTLLGNGGWPDLYLKDINPVHASWCGSDGLAKYWNSDASVESISDALCGARVSIGVDSVELPHIFSNHNSQIYENIRYPEGWSGGMNVSQTPNGAAQQDAAVDAIGNLHLVWLDGRDGNYEIYYASEYDCSGVSLSPIAQAVLNEVGPDQGFCGNNFEDLIILPPGESAFNKFGDLARDARYEVDFTTMIWEEGDIEGAGGRFLQGVKDLYDKVQNPTAYNLPVDYYSQGVRVRILVGLKSYLSPKDQRAIIMQLLDELEVGENNSNWTVEVAVYRNGFGVGNHSHVKTMIVDGKVAVVSGYNVQNDYLSENFGRRDMGIQIRGPIATQALLVFDELWQDAERCDQYNQYYCPIHSKIADVNHSDAILVAMENPIAIGDDIVFSLFRDDTDKTSDRAVVAAMGAATNKINIMQDRFVTGDLLVTPYAEAIFDAVQNQVNVNLIVSSRFDSAVLSYNGICSLKKLIYQANPSHMQYFNARYSNFPVHTKALSVDDSFSIIGSQNFDRSAWGNFNVDLAEYNFAIDSSATTNSVASEFNGYFMDEWNNHSGYSLICPQSYVSLQNEINQAEPNSVVVIPAGVYTESVIIDKPLTIIGADANQTVFQPVEGQPAFQVTSSDVVIANMKISDSEGYGIELIDISPSSLKNIQIYRVAFENNAQGGVLVQGLIPGSPMNYTIENSTFIGGGSGVTINMLETQLEPSFIRNNIFYGQSRYPVEIISDNDSHVEYGFNLFDNCDSGSCVIYWRNAGDGALNPLSSQHDNLFDLEPLFINFEKGAYQLSTDSPAIDAGDPGLTHELDYDGNNDGIVLIDIGAFEYVPIANLSPVVSAGTDQSIELGESATVSAPYSDEDSVEDHSAKIDWGDGFIEDVAVNPTAPNQGEVIGTYTFADPGTYAIEVCVTDSNGGVGCDTVSITVSQQFSFTGFFPPVDNQPVLNTVKAGSAVPIKFRLDGYQGLDIFFAGYPASAVVACGSAAEDAVEQTVTAGGSSLSYDAAADQYTYVWKTDKSWANTCRTFVLRLSDGSYYRANFKFK